MENRVYYGLGGAYRVGYVQWFGQYHIPRGNLNLKLALHTALPSKAVLPCRPGFGAPNGWKWNMSVVELLRSGLRTRLSHLIINAGHWGTSALPPSFWHELAAAGASLRRRQGTRVMWRTSPRPDQPIAAHGDDKPWSARNDPNVTALLSAAGWGVYDAAGVIKNLSSVLKLKSAKLFDRDDQIHLEARANQALAKYVEQHILGCGSCEKDRNVGDRRGAVVT